MFVVIFEVQPKLDQFEKYLELAKLLRPEIAKIEGFIDNERFRSVPHPEKLVSLSTWQDEKALIRWRTNTLHHEVQEKGRFLVFENYRLRVGEVCYDSKTPSGQTLPRHRFDQTQIGPGKAITLLEQIPLQESSNSGKISSDLPVSPALEGLIERELFSSIYTPGKNLVLTSWPALEYLPGQNNPAGIGTGLPIRPDSRYREVSVIRAYGMFDRVETPQYYPELAPPSPPFSW